MYLIRHFFLMILYNFEKPGLCVKQIMPFMRLHYSAYVIKLYTVYVNINVIEFPIISCASNKVILLVSYV